MVIYPLRQRASASVVLWAVVAVQTINAVFDACNNYIPARSGGGLG